jgi:hypothetical protein
VSNSREIKDRLHGAWTQYQQAVAAFDEVSRQVLTGSGGLEHSDRVQAIYNAAKTRRLAFDAYNQAMKEYADYLFAARQKPDPDET